MSGKSASLLKLSSGPLVTYAAFSTWSGLAAPILSSLLSASPQHPYCWLRDRTLRGMDQHLVEELLEVRISFVGRVVREYVEQASLKIT
jgi:hypothetical protein